MRAYALGEAHRLGDALARRAGEDLREARGGEACVGERGAAEHENVDRHLRAHVVAQLQHRLARYGAPYA